MLNPETGLPPLPEGQYWEVYKRDDDWVGVAYWLLLMQKVPKTPLNYLRTGGRYAKQLESTTIGSSADLPVEEDVLDGADEILERLADKEHADNLLGKYPPKKV